MSPFHESSWYLKEDLNSPKSFLYKCVCVCVCVYMCASACVCVYVYACAILAKSSFDAKIIGWFVVRNYKFLGGSSRKAETCSHASFFLH